MKDQELSRALDSEDAEERRRAAARLSEAESGINPELLRAALGDSDWRVRKEATLAAISAAPDPAVLAVLVAALAPGQNVGLRNAAVDALGGFGVHAVAPLASALAALDADGRKLVVDALSKSSRPEALPVLRALLKDPEANVRAAATEAIAAIGEGCAEDAIALLDATLDSPDRFQRMTALEGLNRLGAVLPWERIEPLLDDSMLVPAALVAAGRSAAEPAAPVVVRELERARGRIWEDALVALVELARSGPSARSLVESELGRVSVETRARIVALAGAEDASRENRRLALAAAGLMRGADAAEVAVAALADDALAAEAETVLGELGTQAVEALVRGAASGSSDRRAACLELLGPIASIDPEARSAVKDALSDESADVVAAALAALAEAGDASVIEECGRLLLPETTPRVHQAAQRALAALARRHPARARTYAKGLDAEAPAVEAALVVIEALAAPIHGDLAQEVKFLTRTIASEHPRVRRATLAALAALGGAAVLEPIVFALSDEEPEVRLAAVRALGRLRAPDGSPIALEPLLALAADTKDSVSSAAAVRALGELGDARALPGVRALVRAEPRVAVAAVEALAEFSDPRRAEAVSEALAHPDAEVVKAALRVLSSERDSRVVAHLGVCLEHAAWDVRRLAAELLGAAGGDTALSLLRGRLTNESEPLVREAIADALALAETTGGRRMTAPPPSLGGRRPK